MIHLGQHGLDDMVTFLLLPPDPTFSGEPMHDKHHIIVE
jgi:hypothetical protein